MRGVLLYLRGFFIVGENYNSLMLWYLLSTIYALVFILFLVKKKVKLTHVLILGSIFFAIGCVIPSFVGYNGSLPGVLSFFKKVLSVVVSGRIFKGFLYIPLGMVLAKKKPSVLLGILLALSGFVGNVFLDGIPEDFVVALCSAGVFILVCHIDLKDSAVYSVLRSASTGIYFIHMYVWTAYYSIVYQEKTYGLDSFAVTCIVSLLLSLLYTWVQRKKRKQLPVPQHNA